MPIQSMDWESITPDELKRAIAHVRKTFDTAEWKCSQLTEKLCSAALHTNTADGSALHPYQTAFTDYRSILGPVVCRQFDEILRRSTTSAIFKAYFDVFRSGVATEVRRLFGETVQIGLAKKQTLSMPPVEWAQIQMRFLVNNEVNRAKQWIKNVCDHQDYSTKADEEFIFWKSWRAPKFIHMHPSGNTRYEVTTAWDREEEIDTLNLLDGLSQKFVSALGFELDRIAGEAHVKLAQVGDSGTLKTLKVPTKNESIKSTKSPGPRVDSRKLKIRSLLTSKSNLKADEICKEMDKLSAKNNEMEPPILAGKSHRLWTDAYRDKTTRQAVHQYISRERKQLKTCKVRNPASIS